MVNRFILNEVSYFGPGARKELPGVVARLGFKKALVVTDKGPDAVWRCQNGAGCYGSGWHPV